MQIQLSLPLNGIWVSVSLFCLVLSYSFVQFQDLGQNITHSYLILIWFGYSIAVRLVQNYKPKLVRWLNLWSMIMRMENVVFDQGSFVSPACFLSSEHFALASTSVSVQGRLLSLCSVLCFVLSPQAQALVLLCCLWRSLSSQAVSYSSHHSQSKAWIMCLCCPHNCVISFQVFGTFF